MGPPRRGSWLALTFRDIPVAVAAAVAPESGDQASTCQAFRVAALVPMEGHLFSVSHVVEWVSRQMEAFVLSRSFLLDTACLLVCPG